MIKKTATAAWLAAAALVAPQTSASATEDAPIRVAQGHGLDACPEESLCLYEDADYNGEHDAQIWIITGQVDSLAPYGANDLASSAYMNTSDETEAYLREHVQVGHNPYVHMHGQETHAQLNNVYIHAEQDDWTGDFNDRISSVDWFDSSTDGEGFAPDLQPSFQGLLGPGDAGPQ
ncbi:peptidase inhibitor family I36 protein [Streptomyces sp. XD-27]|uniref:peptidase inhibitor family I36 protein n=1 Tax=Streptomyces sp. XD-27 TaxID=3062779 RepID=UPI0026F447E5|nr:peptidase inhibitor family I36 protein [Streptomyces sp. XD-27]WKX69175.1 peptidase inhibitor family I36 protein [Streptomyces sp. XD-27]